MSTLLHIGQCVSVVLMCYKPPIFFLLLYHYCYQKSLASSFSFFTLSLRLLILVSPQGSRLDDQRCAAPPPPTRGPTVPDEDFFSLILRSQAKRMDEQRVVIPPPRPNPDWHLAPPLPTSLSWVWARGFFESCRILKVQQLKEDYSLLGLGLGWVIVIISDPLITPCKQRAAYLYMHP